MHSEQLRQLLDSIRLGQTSTDEAIERLRHWPYEDLGFAKLDHHRGVRCGFPEVIYCEGKTLEQIETIFARCAQAGGNVLATRADRNIFDIVKSKYPSADYHDLARAITLRQQPAKTGAGFVAIVTAGTADMPVAEEARVTAEIMDHAVQTYYDVGVAGLHRLLAHVGDLQRARVIVVVAGMEGALASVVGGLVAVPVIAVPTSVGYGASFGGLAPLLTMLNSCANNVAVVNIDNGFGAGYIAALISRSADR